MLYLVGIFETRYYWFSLRNSISYNENSIGWVIANDQYRASMGWD